MADSPRRLIGRGLVYRYAGAGRDALSSVDITLVPGRRIALVGANGSGKSTLLLLLKGLLSPVEGAVTVDGLSSGEPDPARAGAPAHLGVGYVFQNPDNQIVATMVDEDVAFGPENLGLEGDELVRRVRDALAAVGLEGMASREPHSLSGGEKQRLALAGALALQPRYLLLDETTSMLDPRGRDQVREVVSRLHRSGEVGILEVTHDLEEALDADEVVLLAAGAVVAVGTPRRVIGDAALLERHGLMPLAATRLALALRAQGVGVPADALSAQEVLAAL